MRQYPNPLRVLKKTLISVLNPFIKLNIVPLGTERDGYPKKPISLPSLLIDFRLSSILRILVLSGNLKQAKI